MLTIQEISANFPSFLGQEVSIRGRIAAVRRMKKSVFADLIWASSKIQCRFEPLASYVPACGDLLEVSGGCVEASSGEPTIDVFEVLVIAKWKAETDYKKVSEGGATSLRAFLPGSYETGFFSQAVRNHIRQFLVSRKYLEVQTPILGKNYNGGRSFPVSSSYLSHRIGFNRTTMEDRMQALIAMGHERIFQIGSVFRSESENTFVEGYESFLSWEDGKQLIKDLLAHTIERLLLDGIGDPNLLTEVIMKKTWREVDFYEIPELKIGSSPETVADTIANTIAEKEGVPTIVNGFPLWSSPLYAPCVDSADRLQRSRIYFPGQKGGLEIGVQENDYERFMERLAKQQEAWKLPCDDERIAESDLATILSGGLPPVFGFGMSPDRIVRIWRKDCTIDPYME